MRSPLIPFRDLHKPVLYKLGDSGHGVRIDLDGGEQVFISPMVDSRGGPAELDLYAAFHEIRQKFLVRVAGRYHSVGIVRLVVQRHMAGARMKYHDDLGLGLPVGDVFGDELKMKDGRRQVALKRQSGNAEGASTPLA